MPRSAQRIGSGFGSVLRIEADLLKALGGDLVAGGQQAIGAGLEILAVHGGDGLRRAFQHVCGPQRTGQVKAFAFQLGGHPSIEHMQAAEVELLHHGSSSQCTLGLASSVRQCDQRAAFIEESRMNASTTNLRESGSGTF